MPFSFFDSFVSVEQHFDFVTFSKGIINAYIKHSNNRMIAAIAIHLTIVSITENANLIMLEMRIKPISNPMAITTSLVMMQLSSQQKPIRTAI